MRLRERSWEMATHNSLEHLYNSFIYLSQIGWQDNVLKEYPVQCFRDMHTIHYIKKGRAYLETANHTYEIKSGEAFYIPPCQMAHPHPANTPAMLTGSVRKRIASIHFLFIPALPYLIPTYMRHIPKVKALCITLLKPALYIIGMNLSGAGKCSTDAGRYLYAPLSPEIIPPIAGRIFRK